MDHRQNLRFIAAGRILIGIVMLLAPRKGVRGWLGRDADSGGVTLLARAFGAREIALGAGTLGALTTGSPARPWVVAGIVSDGVDAAASVLALRHLPARRALTNATVATSATVAGLAALDAVD